MENIQTTPDTFTIPTFQFEDFVARFAKLNRKAKKLGCVPASYNVIGETTIKVAAPDDPETHYTAKKKFYEIPAKLVTVIGTAPQVGNHQLLARIEYLGDGEQSKLFHTVPGTNIKVDERFRGLSAHVCEHCNRNRVRRDTFVVRNVVDGEQKQIGRNCLADFIGGVSPEQIAANAAYLRLFDSVGSDNDNSFRGYFHNHVDTLEVLKLTSVYISLYGWVPKSQADAGFRPTASRVADHFCSQVHFTQEEKNEIRRVNELADDEIHLVRANEVIAWIKNDLAPIAKSDYELNLCTLVVNDLTETRHLGIVCSAVSAYQRAMNRGVEYAKKKLDGAKSEFVGAVGDRLRDIVVSVQFVKTMSSIYGPTTLVKFVDEKGNIMSWFASGDKTYQAGQNMTITGTVKAHKEYQGVKETQLSRVKGV